MDTNNNSSELPEWILIKKAEQDQTRAQRAIEANQQLMSSMAITAGGTATWANLISGMRGNVRGLGEIGINGRVSVFPANNNVSDEHCRVEVFKQGAFPRSAHLDLFYAPNGEVIRGLTSDGRADNKQLTVNPDGTVGIMVDKYSRPVDANTAACLIIQKLTDSIS